MVDAPPLQGVVQFAGAVGGQHHRRRRLGADGPELGHGHLEVRQHLEQEGLELVVSPVDLIDQQDGAGAGPHGPQQRPLDEEAGTEQRVDLRFTGAAVAEALQVQQLAGVVPLIQRLARVDALIALQAHQLSTAGGGQRLGELGLADAGLALQEQRPPEHRGKVHGGGQPPVGQVVLGREAGLQRGDRMGAGRLGHAATVRTPMSSRMRVGVSGVVMTCTPRASEIALVSAAGASTVPPSPTPR